MSIKEAFSIVKANALGFEYQKGEEIIVERGHNCHFLMGIITKKSKGAGLPIGPLFRIKRFVLNELFQQNVFHFLQL